MEIEFSIETKKQLKVIKKTNSKLFKKIEKSLLLVRTDSKHPSLRLHKLKGNLKNTWSISINRNFRMIYFIENNKFIFFKMGTHDEVYERN